MTATTVEEKVPLEAKNKPFMVCGFLGAFWNFCYGTEDHLGSTRMVLNEAGEIQQALMYQPYGTVSDVVEMGATATDPLRQKFTTKEFDEEGDANSAPGIKAYYFGARFYNPDLGVWFSRDAADQYVNSYGYSTNPIMSVDPDGNFSWIPIAIGAAAGGLGGALADKENRGLGFLKGSAIGALGGVLSNYGGGNLFQNMLWGGVEGAITGGMWAGAFGGDVGSGIWQGALWGMAGAAGQSFGEAVVNAHGGYGWHTNTHVTDRLVNEAKVDGYASDEGAQKAIDYVVKRYKLDRSGDNFKFRRDLYVKDKKTQEKIYCDGTQNGVGALISNTAFESGTFLKQIMFHEYGHWAKERVWVSEAGGYYKMEHPDVEGHWGYFYEWKRFSSRFGVQ